MPGITPFNFIDLEGASSIVSVLEEQGYYTIGTHSQPGVNYNRNTSYANLGFDRIYFQPDFVDLYNYGTRPRECDESVYQNLLRWQDETHEQWPESPVFIYNLTFQNHGAYNMLTDEWYRIKILEDYGEYTPLINEYLTTIQQSDEAFYHLTQYFEESEKPVVICMVGDHCPDFAPGVVRPDMSEGERNLKLRSVPFVIWSNQRIESKDMGYISMNMLVPQMLKTAGLQVSPYYEYLTHLCEEVPVTGAYNTYFDADNQEHLYEEDNSYHDEVWKYLYMEYNNLDQLHRREELFRLQ